VKIWIAVAVLLLAACGGPHHTTTTASQVAGTLGCENFKAEVDQHSYGESSYGTCTFDGETVKVYVTPSSSTIDRIVAGMPAGGCAVTGGDWVLVPEFSSTARVIGARGTLVGPGCKTR
jgi:hypothetical protein